MAGHGLAWLTLLSIPVGCFEDRLPSLASPGLDGGSAGAGASTGLGGALASPDASAAGMNQQPAAADGGEEVIEAAGRDIEGARPADHAVAVVEVEILQRRPAGRAPRCGACPPPAP